MKKFIFIIVFLNFLFADGANTQGSGGASVSETTQQELKKIFPKEDAVIQGGGCSWKCRNVNAGYSTQLSGFDFKNGITYCRVYEETNLDQALVYNANQQNLDCVKKIQDKYSQLASSHQSFADVNNLLALAEKNKISSQIKYEEKENQITLSQFLSSIVTLNPDIIDREATNLTGELTLKDGLELVTTRTIAESALEQFGNDLKGDEWYSIHPIRAITNYTKTLFSDDKSLFSDTYQQSTAADGFSKTNMAYFSDLFLNMEKIYQHLQILLFVVVGGFYISSIGANKLQIYLENRGESATNSPYLHKFYIPLLMVGTFFMPIPEANGLAHSTLVQKTIRYFTTQGTEIADMASAIGGKTYMDKIYKSVGGIDVNGIAFHLMQIATNDIKSSEGENIYKNTCAKRYSKTVSSSDNMDFLRLSDKEKEDLRNQTINDREQVSGSEYDITIDACIFLESEINGAKKDNIVLQQKIQGIETYYQGGEIPKRLRELDTYFSIRESQLGWINSLVTPSSAILAELTTYADKRIDKREMESSTQKNIENNKRAVKNKNVDVSDEGEVNDGIIGFIMGRLTWLMLPGADNVKNFVESVYKQLESIISSVVGFFTPAGGLAVSTALSLVETPLVYYFATLIIECTYEKVPLLVCVTASIVAFVSYLVSLCKYFYISPFVVAFSLATKRMNKIVDFLVSGIAIFFKPVLIVLFIYLALFVHTLINEIFIFMSIEQFTNVKFESVSPSGALAHLVASGITALLKIFGILASSYIMWKLIVSGASWALGLVGIDGKQDDVIAQGIESNLARRAFVA